MDTLLNNPLQKIMYSPAPAIIGGTTPINNSSIAEFANYSLPVFKKITSEDMPLIWSYLMKEKGRTTDFSYGGILMWVDYFKYEFSIYKDTLFIKGLVENDRSCPAFSLPVGSLSLQESVEVLRAYCQRNNIRLEFSAVPEYALDEMETLSPVRIEPLTDWGDYLYPAEQLITLTGKKMSKKRNHINRFITENPGYTFTPLTPEDIKDCDKFMDKYDSQLDDAAMGKEESRLARKMIELAASGTNPMKGGVLRNSEGDIIALSIGDVKEDTLFVHIEKADRDVNGSYEMINREFASYMYSLYPEIKYINREDDGGDPGLRKAKESYHPCEILNKYNILF